MNPTTPTPDALKLFEDWANTHQRPYDTELVKENLDKFQKRGDSPQQAVDRLINLRYILDSMAKGCLLRKKPRNGEYWLFTPSHGESIDPYNVDTLLQNNAIEELTELDEYGHLPYTLKL